MLRSVLILVLVALALLVSACDRKEQGSHGHDHGAHAGHDGHDGHEEEPRSAAVTVWAERHELFVEYRLPVVGKPTKFITHVTDMEQMQARSDGPVTFKFVQDSSEFEHTEPAVARPGIYLPEVAFPRAGEWRWTLLIPQEGKNWEVPMPAVRVYASQQEIDALPPEPEGEEGISFLKEQQWKIPFRSLPAGRRDLVQRIRLAAEASPLPWARAEVVAPGQGRLEAPEGKSLPRPGERVEAGQVMAQVVPLLTSSDLVAIEGQRLEMEAQSRELLVKMAEVEAGEIRAKVALEQAEKSHERVKKLVAEGARSPRELEEAEFAVRSAQAELDSAAAVKKVYGDAKERIDAGSVRDFRRGFPSVEVKAPISGTVTEVWAVAGQHVEAGSAIVKILDLSQVRVEARLPESDIARVKDGLPAKAWIGQDRQNLVDLGKAKHVSPEVDPRSRTVGVQFDVENPTGEIRAGMALTVLVETKRTSKAVAIPESAIVDEEGRPIAFVHAEGETCERRDLVLGIRDAGWVEVLSGIEEGERVVTIGAQAVRLASVSSTIPAHGHAH